MSTKLQTVVWFLALLPVVHADDVTAVKVKPIAISEVRQKNLAQVNKKERTSSISSLPWSLPMRSTLTLTVELSGKEVVQASQYGFIDIRSAKDNKGNKLRLLKPGLLSENDITKGFLKIDRNGIPTSPQTTSKDKLRIDLQFESLPRSSTAIAVLEGSLKLRVGKAREVTVRQPSKMIGKTLNDSTLQAAGLTIKVVMPKEEDLLFTSDPSKAVALEIIGDSKKILQIDLVDTTGKVVTRSEVSTSFSTPQGEKTTRTLEAAEELTTAGIGLRIVTTVGLRIVRVPFHMRNIPLP